MNSPSFLAFVLEQLARVTPVTHRRMFGAVGIHAGERFFAILSDDRLYFKVDDTSRGDFEAAGMEPFRPYGDKQSMHYYELPADVLEDVGLLREWTQRSLAAATRSKAARRRM